MKFFRSTLKCFVALLLILAAGSATFAQQSHTLSGTLRDRRTGETVIGATVRPAGQPAVGAVSNEYGFYSLTLPAGSYRVAFSGAGFNADTVAVILTANVTLDVALVPMGAALQEVEVTDRKHNDNIRRTDIGTERLDVKEIEKLPVLFGERDILKTLQLLPGIKSAGEGGGGFFVRGGSADQNLILLDEAPVYNASHLLGFFSTFNSDALKDVSIIKGNSPAQYGGRLSSVLDVRMREGNNQDYEVAGGIGLISSRVSVEGPIQKDRSSFIVSGRRTYADVFLKASPDFSDNRLYFYDLNAKANYRINDKNRIYASGYFGKDALGLGDNFGIDWGNATATIRWNSIVNAKLFSNTSLIYSRYDFNIKLTSGKSDFTIASQIRDWNVKQEFSYYPNARNSVRFGFNSIHHRIAPNRFAGSGVTDSKRESRQGLDNAVFVNNTMKISSLLTLDYGLRASFYTMLGEGTYSIYAGGVKMDSVALAAGEVGKTYIRPEPRIQASFLLNETSSIKGGYARNAQHLHLLSNSTSTTPADQWIGNSYTVEPEVSDQVSLGYFRNFRNSRYQTIIEVYYKAMQNGVDYKNGADLNSAPDIESELLFGIGRAYGAELLVKKIEGKLTGWIGYTLSRTERKIDGINDGDWYAARQDRTHDLSVVATYGLSQRWSLSALFVYNTGNAVTFPGGKYNIGGQTVYYYTERNGYRMPDYHRLDLSATYTRPQRRRLQSSWNIGLYNAYGRENAFTVTFEDDPDDATRTRAVQTALFRWVPSVTYNFKF